MCNERLVQGEVNGRKTGKEEEKNVPTTSAGTGAAGAPNNPAKVNHNANTKKDLLSTALSSSGRFDIYFYFIIILFIIHHHIP